MKGDSTLNQRQSALGLSDVIQMQHFSHVNFPDKDSIADLKDPDGPKRVHFAFWPQMSEALSAIDDLDEETLLQHITTALNNAAVTQQSVVDNIETSTKILFTETKRLQTKRDFFADWMSEYGLDNQEGLALLRLTECFLRVHKTPLAIHLVDEFIESANWQSHFYHSPSPWVNFSSLMLALGSRWLHKMEDNSATSGMLHNIIEKLGSPCVIGIVKALLTQLAKTFVCGTTIDDAVDSSQSLQAKGFSQSFDMLGEEAITLAQADHFYENYHQCIKTLANYQHTAFSNTPGISIKLSAIEPLYFPAHWPNVRQRLLSRLKTLVMLADGYHIPITLDAEESWRLEMQLDVMQTLLTEMPLSTPFILGLAVQAYQKRALTCIDVLKNLCDKSGKSIHIRLVKGAYWDSEIKYSQQQGHHHYNVFTAKPHTDLNYLACATKIMASHKVFYGQFATHNISTLASVATIAKRLHCTHYEFQKLHGMGDSIHQAAKTLFDKKTRVYCPVGKHDELLPYLVRRLLENGVNSSFLYHLNQIGKDSELLQSPLTNFQDLHTTKHLLPAPVNILLPKRQLAASVFPDRFNQLDALQHYLLSGHPTTKRAIGSIIGGIEHSTGVRHTLHSPIDTQLLLGGVIEADDTLVTNAISAAADALQEISKSSVGYRTSLLRSLATVLYEERCALTTLLVYESGKSVAASSAEIREAIDFCYYYATQAEKLLSHSIKLENICGEENTLSYEAKGIVVCISPWNFPLAIFLGQIIAALVTGNAVIAKPASTTPLLAFFVHELLCKAGIPRHWVQLVLTRAETFSRNILTSEEISTVAFTGSLNTARTINQTLANRQSNVASFVAETGGVNVMVTDSSARIDQVVGDVIRSAFDSAGQRCSALRVLMVPTTQLTAYRTLLSEAMSLLKIGMPNNIGNNLGPLISEEAKRNVNAYIALHANQIIYQTTSKDFPLGVGHYIPPTLLEVADIDVINKEVFGPVLHLTGYDECDPESVVAKVNQKKFGLTFGIHSRLPSRIELYSKQIHCGNIYVNRDMIGAAVGMQPFGGRNLSGTGPKAGGSNYLRVFLTEKTISTNTTAFGGNPDILNQSR